MSYASLDELKGSLRINDTDDDPRLTLALDAASDAIDDHCNRTFVASGQPSARYFYPLSNGEVVVDDIYSVVGLTVAVNGTATPAEIPGVSAGYVLEPRNALAEGEPYTRLRYASSGAATWPNLRAGWGRRSPVTVTALWGYALDVPAVVKQACLLQASRIFSRRQSPYGIAGSPDLGSELRLLSKVDPDVAVLLAGKVRYN